MKIITSVHNDQIKHLINLSKKAYRKTHQQFLVEGTRAYTELMQLQTPIMIYMTENYYNNNPDLSFDTIITTIISDHIMEKISHATTPSGICAVFNIPPTQPLPLHGPGIILVDVSDPGNMGTLIRTAAAMKIKEVIIIGGVDPYSPKVIQSTAGCLTAVNIYQTTFENIIAHDKLNLCALVVKDGQAPDKINLTNSFLVVGSESNGLSSEQIIACQDTMTIPMPGQAESLNAAIAGSIALYLMSQQI